MPCRCQSPTEPEDDGKSKETSEAEDTVSDDNRPKRMTYQLQFRGCRDVYLNSFNADDVKVENSGNNTPQVICMSSPFSLSHAYEVWPKPSDNSSSSSVKSSASSVSTFAAHNH